MPHRNVVQLITIVTGAAGAVLLLAGSASAHVRIIADVIPGQPATLQFRVPSELTDADTVRIAVAVPPELKVTAVPPLDGWTAQTLPGPSGKATQVVWTAKSGHAIPPAKTQTFPLKVGPVPDRHSLTFNTEQTYSNGTIAAWNQPQTGSKEPDFPAPVLVIDPEAKAPAATSDHPPTTGTPKPPTPTVATDDQSGPSAGALAGIGGGTALAGVITATLLRRRKHNEQTRP